MKHNLQIAIVCIIAISLTGCSFMDSFLGVNIFDTPLELSAEDIQGMSIADLQEAAGTEDFFDALAEDPALVDEVLAVLDPALPADGAPVTGTAEEQDAAIVATEVLIYSSPAGDLIENLTAEAEALLAGNIPQTPAGDPDVGAILAVLVPDSVMGPNGTIDEAAFIAMIDALAAADEYFQILGQSIGADGYDTGYANPGEIAMNAMLAAAVGAIVVPTNLLGQPLYASTGAYLYALLTDPDNTPEP
ncbi:MAG TPA: hypothetical protein PLC54_00910, partial [Spirochaetales bacterium]|nr:hypothetical protein [Spirochaetales bacterium]